jgi:hypothetical protein
MEQAVAEPGFEFRGAKKKKKTPPLNIKFQINQQLTFFFLSFFKFYKNNSKD